MESVDDIFEAEFEEAPEPPKAKAKPAEYRVVYVRGKGGALERTTEEITK